MFKYKLDRCSEPSNEFLEFVILSGAMIATWIIGFLALGGGDLILGDIKRWWEDRKWKKAIADKHKRFDAFVKDFGLGKLVKMITVLAARTNGHDPLSDVAFEDEYHGDCYWWTANDEKNPSCRLVDWKTLVTCIDRLYGAMNEAVNIKFTDNVDAKIKSISTKYLGSPIKVARASDKSVKLEPLELHDAKFKDDTWFKFFDMRKDLVRLVAYYSKCGDIHKRRCELMKHAFSKELSSLSDQEKETRAKVLKFISLIESLMTDLYRQITPMVESINGTIKSDIHVVRNEDPGFSPVAVVSSGDRDELMFADPYSVLQ